MQRRRAHRTRRSTPSFGRPTPHVDFTALRDELREERDALVELDIEAPGRPLYRPLVIVGGDTTLASDEV